MPIYRKEVNQDYIDSGGERLKGLPSLSQQDAVDPGSFAGEKQSLQQQNRISDAFNGVVPLQAMTDNAVEYGKSKYDTGITSSLQLEDIEDTRSKLQPFVDKFGVGLATFIGKTATATIGGTIGMVNGIAQAIHDGEWSSVYNNDFNKGLDKMNDAMDGQLKVYLSDEERNGSLLQQTVGSKGFWTKSIMGDALSFTAGAVLSAYAVGGVGSLISKVGNIGAIGNDLAKTANFLKKFSSALNGTEEMSNVIKTASVINKITSGAAKFGKIGTKLFFGSGYEAGTESMDMIKQATTKQESDWVNKYGEPNTPELKQQHDDYMKDFNDKILSQSNAVYLTNLVLVGGASLATLPTVFGAGLKNTIAHAVEKNVLKGAEKAVEAVGETAVKTATRSTLEAAEKKGISKILSTAGKLMAPAFSEGIQEEGGQNLTKNLALDYIDKTYNVDSAKNTYNMINSFGNSLEKSFATVDGWKDIVSGMIIGSLGAPNLSKIGKAEIIDGKKYFRPSLLDEEKAWWTGGMLEKFQEETKLNKEAAYQRDAWKKYGVDETIAYMKNNQILKQGSGENIASSVYAGATSSELDAMQASGDFAQAKTAEHDLLHQHIKSRIDAGYEGQIEEELIKPTERMSAQEFGETYGYKNMTDEELTKRKSETIATFRDRVSKTKEAITNADRILDIDLSEEHGKLHRDTLIYALATVKNVEDRINILRDLVKKNLKDSGLTHEHDDARFKNIIDLHETVVKDLTEKPSNTTDENEKESIQKRISDAKKIIAIASIDRDQSESLAKTLSDKYDKNGKLTSYGTDDIVAEKTKSVHGAIVLANLVKLFNKTNEDPNKAAERKDTDDALKDLQYLIRRKEETIELYATAKNMNNWNNFTKTHRITKLVEERQAAAFKKFIDDQNAEHDKAVAAVDNETPETESTDTGFDSGVSADTINKLKLDKKRAIALTTQEGIDGLIAAINEEYITNIDSEEHLVEVINSLRESGNDYLVDLIQRKLDKVIRDANKNTKLKPKVVVEVTPVNESEVGDLSDNTKELQDSNSPSNTIESVDIVEKEVSDNETSQNQEHYIGNKLRDAYRHIAYLARNFANVVTPGGLVKQDLELNEKASKLILDYTKVNVGTPIILEVMHDYVGDVYTGEFGTKLWSEIKTKFKAGTVAYNNIVPIAIKSNGVIIGYLHDMNFMNDTHIAASEGNIENNQNEIARVRNYVVKNNKTSTTVSYRSNGKLIKINNLNPNDVKLTNEAFKDKLLNVTVLSAGSVTEPRGFVGNILNKVSKNIQEGIVALIPVNQDQKTKSTKYIAVPLSPIKLQAQYVESITTIMDLYMRNLTVELSKEESDRFNLISSQIDKTLTGLGTESKPLSFNTKTLTGLRNYISLFTYVRKTVDKDMKMSLKDKDKMAFSVDSMPMANKEGGMDNVFVVSFGVPGRIISYKISRSDANVKGVRNIIVGRKDSSMNEYSYTVQDMNFPDGRGNLKMRDFSQFKQELSDHLSSSFFYSNKGLIDKKLSIPIINAESKEGESNVKITPEANYSEHLKNNTETNLTSFNISSDPSKPHHIYTVQANIAFDTTKMDTEDRIDKEKAKIPEPSKPSQLDVDARNARLKEIEDAKNAVKVTSSVNDIKSLSFENFLKKYKELAAYARDSEKQGNLDLHDESYISMTEAEIKMFKNDVDEEYVRYIYDSINSKTLSTEFSKPENLVTSNQSIESSLDVKDKSTELIKEDEELVRSLGLNSKTKDTDEDYDIAISDESEFIDNSNVGISTAPTVDLQSDYINFFKNDLNREQQSILREQVSNGNIQVKCE